LQIFFSSGDIFRISSLSVEIVPPDFGSRREEIVPPVMIIATFGKSEACVFSCGFFSCGFAFCMTFAVRISDSLIPML